MRLSEKLDFVIPTSISPIHPSTDLIEQVIESCWGMLGERVPPVVICDYPSPFFNEDDRERYKDYISMLHAVQGIQVVEQTCFRGQVGAVIKFFSCFNTKPVIYYHHDDWVHLDSDRVDADKLVDLIADPNKNVEMVKFHKRRIDLVDRKKDGTVARRVDHIKIPTEEFGVPLVKCSGWGTSPHFASRRHYTEKVLPGLRTDIPPLDPHGRRGIENGVYEAYRKEQIDSGFESAHNRWGVYLYGKIGDEAYINHRGVERLRRRRENDKNFGVNYGSGFTYSK